MANTTAMTGQTLIGAAWPAHSLPRPLRLAFLVVGGAALLTLSAKVQVPFWPVPMTMQTLAVLAIGMAYGWRLGGATLLLYMMQGAVGLPVFAGTPEKGLGIAYMMGPTGGYLLGFVIAAILVGWLAERGWDRRIPTTALALLLGNIVIYVPGVLWLATLIGFEQAFQFGLAPFLAGDAVKLMLAAAALPLTWRAVRRWRDA